MSESSKSSREPQGYGVRMERSFNRINERVPNKMNEIRIAELRRPRGPGSGAEPDFLDSLGPSDDEMSISEDGEGGAPHKLD